MSSVDFRDARLADCPVLARAMAELPLFARYGVTESGLAHDFQGALGRGDGLLVACVEQIPVGLAWYLSRGAFGRGGYLRLIAIAPGSSRKGLGSRLLAEVEERVSRANRALFLLVSDFNTEAQQFYGRHGYALVGRLPAFVRPDIDELLYWKRLGAPLP